MSLFNEWYVPFTILLAIWSIGVVRSILRIRNKPLAKWRKYVIEQEKKDARGTTTSDHGGASSGLSDVDQQE